MKTIQEMAREAAAQHGHTFKDEPEQATIEFIEAFAALVREAERERIAKWYESEGHMMFPVAIPKTIRSGK